MPEGNTVPMHPHAAKPAPIYLNPGMSLEDQKAMLDKMVDAGGWQGKVEPYARMITITPHLAQHILDTMETGNRKRSPKKVKDYATAMRENAWTVTGQTIIFSKSGKLLDGGHRLLAVSQSGKKIRTLAVFGVEDWAFSFLDIGRKRTNQNVLEAMGVAHAGPVSAAIRWLDILTTDPHDRGRDMSNEQMRSLYDTHYKDNTWFDEAVALGRKVSTETIGRNNRRLFPAGTLAAFFYLYGANDNGKWAKVRDFAESMIGDSKRARSNAAKLVKRVSEKMRSADGRLHENIRNILIARAIHKTMAGQMLGVGEMRSVEITDPFPNLPKMPHRP